MSAEHLWQDGSRQKLMEQSRKTVITFVGNDRLKRCRWKTSYMTLVDMCHALQCSGLDVHQNAGVVRQKCKLKTVPLMLRTCQKQQNPKIIHTGGNTEHTAGGRMWQRPEGNWGFENTHTAGKARPRWTKSNSQDNELSTTQNPDYCNLKGQNLNRDRYVEQNKWISAGRCWTYTDTTLTIKAIQLHEELCSH